MKEEKPKIAYNQKLNVALYSFYFDGIKSNYSNGTWTALPKKKYDELIIEN